MKKIEAPTLEEAYTKACRELGCTMSELKYEIVQYPSKGFLGFFSKDAVIVATKDSKAGKTQIKSTRGRRPAQEAVSGNGDKKKNEACTKKSDIEKKSLLKRDASVESTENETERTDTVVEKRILESFFVDSEEDRDDEGGGVCENEPISHPDANPELCFVIENSVKDLIRSSCFDIDTIEVDVIGDTAYIFIDGDDAALIIGKEGYRYNALSYLLFNWLHSKYGLYLKLEIAQFISTQQEMIRNYIQTVIEHVNREGWGRTRSLDGVLAQIALEQLRDEFPDKYVAIKRHRDGSRYILINDFIKRK